MAQMFILARLGRDVEIRYTQNGDAVAELALAYNYGQKGQDGKRPSQWVRGSLWGKRAESLAPHLLKGASVVVTLDDPHIETFDRKDGGQGFNLVGRVSNLEFAGGGQQQSPAPAQQPRPAPQQAPQRTASSSHPFADMDDDLPPF